MKKENGREAGFLLITLYMLMPLLLVVALGLASRAFADIRAALRVQASTQAFYLAEAAVDEGYSWLRSQSGPPGGTEALVLNGGYQSLGQGIYLVTVDPDDDNPDSYTKRYTIQGWGSTGDLAAPLAVRQTSLVVQVESFARYAYLTNSETSSAGQTVWFRTGDRIEGPTHTNGRFSMYGTPTFDGFVSSVADSINYYNPPPAGGNSPNFNDGLELGSENKSYPTSIPSSLMSAATSGGIRYEGDTTIVLQSNGTMRVTNIRARLSNAVRSVPENGLVYVSGNATLSGTLNGQMTVAARGNVRVPASITYADDPRTNPNSDDLLGILAGGNVIVPSTAPINVEIDAAIMALGSSFTVENYWRGPAKGTLTVYGGINQRNRGPVGTFSGSTGRMLSGYTKSYHYDGRLRNMIPPYFPLTGDYNTLVWQDLGNE